MRKVRAGGCNQQMLVHEPIPFETIGSFRKDELVDGDRVRAVMFQSGLDIAFRKVARAALRLAADRAFTANFFKRFRFKRFNVVRINAG